MGQRSLLSSVRSFLFPLLDLALPPLCLSCGALTDAPGAHLCALCRASLSLVQNDDPVYGETWRKLRASCLIDGLVSLYAFEKATPLQSLIHALKYGGMTSVGDALGAQLGGRIVELYGAPDNGVIVPIPLHKARLRERGYNQAGVIAAGVSRVCGVPVRMSFVERRRNTVSQTTLTMKERSDNVAGAFCVRQGSTHELKETMVFLVDDVITTGSTVVECARVLRECGAGSILACSIALASRNS